ncbi:hypothetical protein BaRGS_00031718, partial [Batillaria attramentaria]
SARVNISISAFGVRRAAYGTPAQLRGAPLLFWRYSSIRLLALRSSFGSDRLTESKNLCQWRCGQRVISGSPGPAVWRSSRQRCVSVK